MAVKLQMNVVLRYLPKNYVLIKKACIAGSKSMKNMAKVHFPETGMQFYAMSMKSKTRKQVRFKNRIKF